MPLLVAGSNVQTFTFSSYNLHAMNFFPLFLLQATLNTRQMDMPSVREDHNPDNADQLVLDFKQQLQIWPCLRNL